MFDDQINYLDIGAYSLPTEDCIQFLSYCRVALGETIKHSNPINSTVGLFGMGVIAHDAGYVAFDTFVFKCALELVRYDGMNLENFKCYNSDETLVGVAVAQNKSAFQFASKELRQENGAIHTRYMGNKTIEMYTRKGR